MFQTFFFPQAKKKEYITKPFRYYVGMKDPEAQTTFSICKTLVQRPLRNSLIVYSTSYFIIIFAYNTEISAREK